MEQTPSFSTTKNSNTWDDFGEDNDDLLLVNENVNLNTSSLRTDERYVGFDNNCGDTWLYPSNFPERAYQYNIVQKALFQNTLVVLPTGLGKTFIAAVVMYNMYRWYPMGKVVFMAPTKPLVAQQIDACCKIMGIPIADSVEITGKLSKAKRAQLWQTKRVFFATPQSVQSDIMDTEVNFPFHAIKLIVVDEAHRAKGRYSYTEVIGTIWGKNKYFRILALSATPGRRKEDVEEVIRNLFISSLEVRTEDSVDVVSYVHKRLLKTVVVELGDQLKAIRDELLAIADPHLRNLIDNHLISNRPGSISRNWLVMEQKRFRESLANNRVPQQKELSTDFSICISIYHSIELLERHGTRVFLNNFDETQDGGAKFVVKLLPNLRRLIERIREETGPSPFAFSDQPMVNGEIAAIPRNIDFGHPKFEIARDHVLEHFQKNEEARCIIFCEYRESVMLMHRLLLQHRPLIRPKVFVGQGGTGSIRAVTQRQQMKVMNDFRSGGNNALIATSVAEEGIDVGEVDLIVCFDINTSNPTRFIQRIGRTGRKKQGKVLLLATEGKEYALLKEVLSERNRLNKSISRGGEFSSALYKQAPRMVPTEFNPKCLKTFIQPHLDEQNTMKNNVAQTKKKVMPVKGKQPRDLRHFFKPKADLNREENEAFENVIESHPDANSRSKADDNDVANIEPDIIDFSPIKASKIDSKVIKKMAKYIRTSSTGKTMDMQKILASNKLSESSMQFLVDFSANAVHDVWSQMQMLWKKGINEDNLPTKGISPEERKAVKSYNKLICMVGSKDRLTEVMMNQKENLSYYFALIQKYNTIFKNLHTKNSSSDNFDYLSDNLEKLSSQMVSNNSKSESLIQSMVYDAETEKEFLVDSLRPEESRCEYNTDYILDSKYMSQWDETSHIVHSFRDISHKQQKNVGKNGYSSDEDVEFVGEIQQSTPIRNMCTKQTMLNFRNSPILKTALHNCIDSKQHQQQASPIVFDRKQTPSQNEVFFDDQFDDIIAANSKLLAHIECSEICQTVSRKSKIAPIPSSQKLSDNKLPVNHSISAVPLTPQANINILQNINSSKKKDTQNKSPEKQFDNAAPSSITHSNCNDNLREIHAELADIDFNDFSEVFSDEMDGNVERNSYEEDRPNSPDIFEDFSLQSKSELKDCKTPSKLSKIPTVEISPCVLTKRALTWKEVRLRYGNSEADVYTSHKKPNTNDIEPDDSAIHVPLKNRLKRRIIDSDSDTSEQDCTEKPVIKGSISTSNKGCRNSLKKPRIFRHQFIDDEAVHSGSETEDEIEHTQGCYMIDSVVVHDDDAEDDGINMTGVYLSSVRSPCKSSIGKFKIPPRRQYNDASKIFSQKVVEDNNSYEQDSFIISEEEVEIDQSLCPLERAEEILKNRKRSRRNANWNNYNKQSRLPNRKRVLRILHESDEDFE